MQVGTVVFDAATLEEEPTDGHLFQGNVVREKASGGQRALALEEARTNDDVFGVVQTRTFALELGGTLAQAAVDLARNVALSQLVCEHLDTFVLGQTGIGRKRMRFVQKFASIQLTSNESSSGAHPSAQRSHPSPVCT